MLRSERRLLDGNLLQTHIVVLLADCSLQHIEALRDRRRDYWPLLHALILLVINYLLVRRLFRRLREWTRIYLDWF